MRRLSGPAWRRRRARSCSTPDSAVASCRNPTASCFHAYVDTAGGASMTNIRTERDGAVGTITIDRVSRFNSLDATTARDLRKAALQYARDDSIRAVVITGAGGVFCSGADLKYIAAGGADADLAYLTPDARDIPRGFGEVFKQILEYLHSTISEIRRSSKPFIAAVDGIAAAGGFGLAMACDLVLASDRSSFEWAYSKTDRK